MTSLIQSERPTSAIEEQQYYNNKIFHFIFSAQSEKSLRNYLVIMNAYLHDNPVDLQQLSYNLSVYRTSFDYRVGFVCSSHHELISAIDAYLLDPVMDKTVNKKHKIAFVFSGEGHEWEGVGQDLYETEPTLRAVIYQCQSILTTISEDLVLVDFFNGKKNIGAVNDNANKQLLIFVLQLGLAIRWFSLGVEPYAVCGHGVGEITAAFFSGFIDLEYAIHLIYQREKASSLVHQTLHTRLFSTATGDELTLNSIAFENWIQHRVGTMKFEKCISNLLKVGILVFIEIGPHTVLSKSIHEQAQSASIVTSLVKNSGYKKPLYSGLVHLFRLGCSIQWSQLFLKRENKILLPQYCWDRQNVMDPHLPHSLKNNLTEEAAEEDEILMIITGIWQEILSIEYIEPDVDMSDYNINSLNVIQFISRVRSFLGVDLTISQLVNYRTARAVAEYITNAILEMA